jgi:nicotinate-nucleotide adenylyltransferase
LIQPPTPAPAPAPIGILGGAFDPIHHGHLRLAVECRERLGLAAVHLVPFHAPNHRGRPVASAADRLAMVAAACAGEPGLVADARELRRGGVSYTVDTLEELRRELGPDRPLVLLLGEDACHGLPRWHRPADLLRLAHLAVVARPGATPPADPAWPTVGHTPWLTAPWFTAPWFTAPWLTAPWLTALGGQAVADPAALTQRPAGGCLRLAIPSLAISSTALRAALAAGRSIRYLSPDPTIRYLLEHALYS